MNETYPRFYDVVDYKGNVIETAEEQARHYIEGGNRESAVIAIETNKEIPLERQQPELTPGEIKKLRKKYITVQHPKVVVCQHRLDLNKQPVHRNCQSCWFAWFQNHGEIVQQLDEMFVADGEQLIIQLQGKKFYHRWRQFMATIAQWKQVEATETNE
jgi:hypothetical protein